MSSVFRSLCLISLFGSAAILSAQSATCVTSAVPPIVHTEGLAERIGDINIVCNGTPSATFNANIAVSVNTNITNRISTGTTLTGIVFTIDSGSGPQAVTSQPALLNTNTLTFNGVSIPFSAQGTAALTIANVRVNAHAVGVNNPIVASIAVNGAGLALVSTQPVVGRPQLGLYVSYVSELICAQNGSPLPANIDFANLIQAGTAFGTTRFTEGYGDAFAPKSSVVNLNADSGTRVIVNYSGFPSDAQLYVPDVIAGSTAIQPTAGGDFELPASGGAYAPSAGGSLLLARVPGADANGAGGTPVYQPGAIGSGTVMFNSVSPLTIVNGSAYVVYEVVDANPNAIEFAQFPTFMGLAPNGNRSATQTSAALLLAPQSTATMASPTAPIPRFAAVAPQPDCTIVGDCASALPNLTVSPTSLQFNASTGGKMQQNYFAVLNTGGITNMPWQISTTYGTGSSGWLSLSATSGSGTQPVYVYVTPGSLAPETYTATLTVDAGPYVGSKTVGVTLTVTTPVPTISQVLNAASLTSAPVVPGSLTTLMGTNFTGKNVTTTFDGIPATVSFSNGTQINLLVPAALSSKAASQLIVTVDGNASQARTVNVAGFAPAIFTGGVLNQDYTSNDAAHGAKAGSIIQVFATGLSGSGTITGRIHDRDISVPYYAGPAPGFPGAQQVDMVIPSDLPAMTTAVYVCATPTGASAPQCSTPVPLTIK
jgi:uncharacterized protein (TIGR03437 family)